LPGKGILVDAGERDGSTLHRHENGRD
jgi:hypothetical protein